MAPSRGSTTPAIHNSINASDDVAVNQQSQSALVAARRNFKYLIDPSTAKDHPSRFRTRALLRTFRYMSIFIFWRLVRWAKYIAVGSLVAAVGATASGIIAPFAWIAAPPTMGAAIISATVWGVGKWGARRLHKKWERTGGDEGEELREHEELSPVKREGTWRQETGPNAIPW